MCKSKLANKIWERQKTENSNFRSFLKKTHILNKNLKKTSLVLIDLMNTFNAKKFSIKGVECNKVFILSLKNLLIIDFTSKKDFQLDLNLAALNVK